MTLLGQTVLITGAAGRIGSATALAVMQHGGNVILSDIAKEKLNSLSERLSSIDKARVLAIESDVTTTEGIDSLIEKSLKKFKKIDSAIHSAYPTSEGWGTHFEKLELSNLNQDLSMQLGGAIIFSQRILSYFKKQKKGNLIHISSIFGIQPPKFHHYEGTNMTSPIEYAAIKAGVISITRWLAKYHKNQGIRVNCVSPGGILDQQPNSFLERYRESCTNIGMLEADNVVSTLIFLLSPMSEAVNGQNIVVDDGWTL